MVEQREDEVEKPNGDDAGEEERRKTTHHLLFSSSLFTFGKKGSLSHDSIGFLM